MLIAGRGRLALNWRMSNIPHSAPAVGTRIALLRHMLGLKQSEFADTIGVLRGELGAWESGGRKPSIAKAKQILERYPGLTLDWIFLGDARHLTHEMAASLDEAARELARLDQESPP